MRRESQEARRQRDNRQRLQHTLTHRLREHTGTVVKLALATLYQLHSSAHQKQ